jgi:pyruvate/2-oxoglutarate dehydrogenase complex dihydrolipoamide acyltransferase (E2) component
MEEATVVLWLKRPGETVRQGEAVAEVETEKVTFEIEAPTDGVLQVVAQEGQVLAVGGIMAYVLAVGETPQESECSSGPFGFRNSAPACQDSEQARSRRRRTGAGVARRTGAGALAGYRACARARHWARQADSGA